MRVTADELTTMLENNMMRLDKILERLLDEVETRDPVSCRKCPHATAPGCCYQKTMVDAQEGLAIARHLRNGKMDTPELRKRLRELGEEMEAAGREDWFHNHRQPCVFLANGRCSIYPVRPHACRTYYVVNDPALCQPGAYDGILSLDVDQFNELHFQQTRALHQSFGLNEGPHRIYTGTLPKIVAIACEADGDIKRYRRLLNREPWPRADRVSQWLEGDNPHREKLVQIRKHKASP